MNNQQELAMRLYILVPTQWMADVFTKSLWDREEHKTIIENVVALNQGWVEEVVNGEHSIIDVVHDFRGIYAEDEHFLPRIA